MITRRRLICAPALSLAGISAPGWAAPAERVALVIGNGAYRVAPLRNPVADAQAVAAALRRIDLVPELVQDADSATLRDAISRFADKTLGAKLRVVYFAGHGAQINGRNYLIPIDADIFDEDDLKRKSVNASELVERLTRQPQSANLLIIDACRNDPAKTATLLGDGRQLRTRGGPAGLARMPAPAGSLIAYATAPGKVADDSATGAHSLYTKHLLAHLETPGLTLEQLFKRVRLGVLEESQSKQQPWDENSLTVEVCLSGRCTG